MVYNYLCVWEREREFKAQAQLDYLIKKANKRTFLLLHYKRSGVPKERLKDVYCAMNRSILEYTSNIYHSLINIGQSNELELIQKRNLRIIYGYNHDYHTLLQISGLTSLKDRRIESFKKFAHKTVTNAKYSHWLPKNPSERLNRNTALYKEETAIGNRLYNSPIFAMRRLLNDSTTRDHIDLSGLFNSP